MAAAAGLGVLGLQAGLPAGWISWALWQSVQTAAKEAEPRPRKALPCTLLRYSP